MKLYSALLSHMLRSRTILRNMNHMSTYETIMYRRNAYTDKWNDIERYEVVRQDIKQCCTL